MRKFITNKIGTSDIARFLSSFNGWLALVKENY